MRNRAVSVVLAAMLAALAFALAPPLEGWGDEGHRYVSTVAVNSLPDEIPAFFRKAAARLIFLGPEPDRWRDNRQTYKALREAGGPDHFIDIDKPENFQALPDDRYQYADWLRSVGKAPKDIGFLPYACLETYEQVQVSFRLWREAGQAGERSQIEQNIVHYAGVLGHYVADGAQPLHTTVHYNGWTTSWNPEGYSREPLHWRFEGEYVQAKIKAEDFKQLVKTAQRLPDPFHSIMQYLLESHGTIPELYRLDKQARWAKDNTNRDSKQFVVSRLAAAAQTLANLWYTAWLDSELPQRSRN